MILQRTAIARNRTTTIARNRTRIGVTRQGGAGWSQVGFQAQNPLKAGSEAHKF